MRRAQPVQTVKPSRTVTLRISLRSSDIYTQSSTSCGAWNIRHANYTAEFRVEASPDYPTVPGGLYTVLVDRRVQLRKDETFSQDHGKFSIIFPSVPRLSEDATRPTTMQVGVIFARNGTTTASCNGTGDLWPSGWSCGPISFTVRDGDLDTLTSPWTTIDITLLFPLPAEQVNESKATTVGCLRHMLGSAADCIVIASDGTEFHVHRSMLSALSPVFAAMFEHDTAEKHDGTVKIADVNGNVMEEFLVFLYNHSVDVEQIKDFLEDLYHAADKYDVPELRTICENMMCTTLDAKNAVQRLAFAHDRGMKKLKMKAIDFISENKTSI